MRAHSLLLMVFLMGAAVVPGGLQAEGAPGVLVADASSFGEREALVARDGAPVMCRYWPGQGKGPSVLLVLGVGEDPEAWTPLMAKLALTGRPVLSVVLRDVGLPGDVAEAAQSVSATQMAGLAADIGGGLDALKQKSLGPTRVVASGIAGSLVLKAASPQEVEKFAWLSPGLLYAGVEADVLLAAAEPGGIFFAVSREDSYSSKSLLVLDALANPIDKEVKLYAGAGHGPEMLSREPGLVQDLTDWLQAPLATEVLDSAGESVEISPPSDGVPSTAPLKTP